MKIVTYILILVCSLCFVSCGAVFDINSDAKDGEYRSPITGRVVRATDDGSKVVIDSGTISFWAKIVKFITKKDYRTPLQENLLEEEEVPSVDPTK